jgi:hypothetical protein
MGGKVMFSANQLCKKITTLYPEIGACGIDIDVIQDSSNKMWIVHLEKNTHSLKHFLELMDADQCMKGKQCVSLGLEIAQLQKNIEGKQF